MFAWQYTSTEGGIDKHFKLNKNAPVPTLPKKGATTLVKVLTVAINPQDYKVPEMPIFGRLNLPPPSTPGTDYVGRVHETTDPELKKGDLVYGSVGIPQSQGALAEYVAVKKPGAVKVSEEIQKAIDPRQLACLGTAGLTALQCFEGVKPGARVFVNGGSGGTGTFCIQIAKNVLGSEKVVTTCSPSNASFVKTLGADQVIDYTTQNVIEALSQEVEATKQQFDLIIDNVGNDHDLYWQSHRYLKPNGKFIQVGVPKINLGFIFSLLKMYTLPGFLGGGKRRFQVLTVVTRREDLEKMAGWMAEGKLRAMVAETFEFDEVPRAFAMLKTGRAKGKLLVDVAKE